jgi:hypothetical protein
MRIDGTVILTQPEGCNLIIGQLTLPASRQFESKADWNGPGIIVPQAPDLLLPEEVSYANQHQAMLEGVSNIWEDPKGRSASITAPGKGTSYSSR